MIKLQLDDKALKALVDSAGPEFVLELQNSVIQNFAGKYLKALADERVMRQSEMVVKEHVDNIIIENVGRVTGYPRKAHIDERLIEKLNENIKEMVNDTMSNLISEKLKNLNIDEHIDLLVNKKIDDRLKNILSGLK